MCTKTSASCLGAFPFDRCFEICLQKGSVFCIWSSASNLSADKDFGVVCPVSGVTGPVASVCSVWSWVECCWAVLLLVLNVHPSGCAADSMLIIVGWFWGNSTRCDRQSAALLCVPDIYLKVMLYVACSSPHLLTLLFVFSPLRNLVSSMWSFLTITSAPCR